MAGELGKAYVQIVPSANGIGGAIGKALGNEAGIAGINAGKGIAGKIKGVLATAGLGAALGKSLNAGAELQQNLGGTEAVFGDYCKTIQDQAKTAYMNMGLSASDYMATANKMGSLFQGSGLSQARSLELTSSAMQRAADVASVMGIDTTDAMDAISAAAKGNFTMMDNLGVAMNATTLEAYALEKGINFKWNTASNAEKAELAMKMFMDRTSQYAGNFADEAVGTFSGSFGAMKAAAQDFMANLMVGQDVNASMKNLTNTAVTFLVGNLIPAIGRIFTSLPSAISALMEPGLFAELGNLMDSIASKLPGMIPQLLNGLMSFSETLRGRAGEMVNVGLEFIRKIADGIIQNIPVFVQTVPTIISNFAGLVNDNAPKIFETALGIMKNLALGLIKAIPVIIQNLPQIIQAIWNVFTAFQWMNLGKQVINGIKNGFKAAGEGIKTSADDILNHVKEKFTGGFTGVKDAVLSIFNGIKSGITSRLNAAKTAVTDVISGIKRFFPFRIGKILSLQIPKISLSGGKAPWGIAGKGSLPKFHVTWMAQGGILNNPTLIGAGEAGPEAVLPLDRLWTELDRRYDQGGLSQEQAGVLLRILDRIVLLLEEGKTISLNRREFARLVSEVQ